MTKGSDLKEQFYDVVIVGGGMVGAAQAAALVKQQKRVLVIEKYIPNSDVLAQIPLRVSAINLASEQYLTELGVWSHIGETSKCMFNQLATWEQRHKPVIFSATDIQKSHLGYLIRNEALQLAAYDELNNTADHAVDIITDCKLTSIDQTNEQVSVQLTNHVSNETIIFHCSLLIGADGAFSQVRSLTDIGTTGWDYQQHCLSLTIKTDFPTQHITWQEFQPSGPKAFLPLEDGYSVLIWYDNAEELQQLVQLSNEQLKNQVLTRFPDLAGEFDVVAKASFPLTRRQANQYIKGRVVLVGDSAHTINPLAGQGVNIGYKDVEVLSQLLEEIDIKQSETLSAVLKQYENIRKRESQLMSLAMDSFYNLFSNDKAAVKLLRGGLLTLANKFEWAKKQVLKKAVGY
ncbi:FAD-dependent monooxygenase [Psychrosphaera aquimarina]|uniref:FAD-dependent monooxygenase n=1 Tax=Psychrosphaera aquimarina TaxID=2044854 RepID=A0ABU3QW76_9GAMM|nr:FAD-dependent monooxygenase [Psychrosphaera aquimarina]MDU0111539.1 FAD-dependent monooxygenase [Psychrosphaera aquimarina]